MNKRLTGISGLLLALSCHGSALAQCTDKEFGVFQVYDTYLEVNPDVPDTQLRQLFAARIGMQPAALKNLYTRCVIRWANRNPEEARAYLRREQQAFIVDCKKRPASDQICKAALGK